MNRTWTNMLVLIVLWGAIAIAGFGSAVWQLWNWLMPALFGLPHIGYWQAVGLMALCWLLFGGWRGAGGFKRRSRHGRRQALTDDERAHLRASIVNRSC